ncbi:MAG: TetR/AcrR family transcriptional regulator [Victivallaceae bacterium]
MARKLQQRAIETRKRILTAARELFAERGYSGATVDEIALRAKANKQRIYAYFGNKQQLFETVVLQLFQEVDLFAQTDMQDCQPADLSHRVIAGFFKVHSEHPEFWRLLTWINLDEAIHVERLIGARSHENAAIREVFDRGIKEGVIKPMLFRDYLYTLLAASWFYFSNRRTLPLTLSPDLYSAGGRQLLIDEVAGLFNL